MLNEIVLYMKLNLNPNLTERDNKNIGIISLLENRIENKK